jgi:IclR family transcriptional regulator, KDG regulon repressor
LKKNASHQFQNQTLSRALLVLEAIGSGQTNWGTRELSREVGLNVATVFRIVSTLHAAGYLEREADTQRYSLGPKIMKLAGQYKLQNSVSSVAEKVFESYADRFPHNFYLGKVCDYEVIYLISVDGRGPIRIAIEPGGSIELHTTALGKLLLAYQTDEYVQSFLRTRSLKPFTARTITNPVVLCDQIEVIRKRGFAVNDGEHYDDISAVAAPVFDSHGQVTIGVSLAFPRHYVQEGRLVINELVALAGEIAGEITFRSGGSKPP